MPTSPLPNSIPASFWQRPETRVVGALLVLVGLIWAFLELGEEVGEKETLSFDDAILLFFRRGPHHGHIIGPDWMRTVATQVTALGSAPVIVLLVLIVIGYLVLSRHVVRAVEVTLASFGGALIGLGLKAIYVRPRPTLVPRLVSVSNWSFPSGHSTISAVVYLTLGVLIARFATTRRQRIYAISVACLISFLVGWTRIALGVHYPTDVLAGWTVGLAWALFSWLIVNAWENWKARDIEQRREEEMYEDTEAEITHRPRESPGEEAS